MDHRSVQRTLFRMQLDPEFAGSVRAGEVAASAGLGEGELALLRSAAPAALSADLDGRRRAVFLANVSGEFALSRAAGLEAEGFPGSEEFHAAVRADRSLPLAFASYAIRCSADSAPALRALIALESALARARRETRAPRSLARGELALSESVSLLDLPEGTLALAAALREALDRGAALPDLTLASGASETLLLRSSPAASAFRLRELSVELASPALAALLRAACEPRTREALAERLALELSELETVVSELLADGVLVAA